jgi:hypothetical protein
MDTYPSYRKNDQAWIEQKNSSVVRRLIGYGRHEGLNACQLLAQLFEAAHFHVNDFQPSFKLRKKTREGTKVKKTYCPPATPRERLLSNPLVDVEIKEKTNSAGIGGHP